ncbi:MAG: ATP-binding cassette domain-containing protein [Thiolinea sp.]
MSLARYACIQFCKLGQIQSESTARQIFRKKALDQLAVPERLSHLGMHTIVPEGGGTFSGGQRQRLIIARALVNRPRILLLDEATSALDNKTQAMVSESLEKIKATRIVVAHRLSTIRNADRIIVLDKGEIRESGSYDELMADEGVFYRLVQRQLLAS